MDDHDLGALLDASVPARPASDAALTRIHRRAAQRRRRAAVLSGALTVVVVVVAALGISWVGGPSKRVTPGGGTTPSSVPSGTTTIVPDGRCFSGDVSMSIDAHRQVWGTTARWAIVAVTRSDTPCRPVGTITATISDSGHGLASVSHTLDALHAAIVLAPDTPTVVANLAWNKPCSAGPVEFDVTGVAAAPARLTVPRQSCASKPNGGSDLVLEPRLLPGGACPKDSIVLTIDPHAVSIGTTTRWTITGTARTDVTCRTYGLDADIETPDGKVLTGIPGNPAVQNDQFEDLFVPSRREFVDDLSWSAPCSVGPVVLVVHYHDGMSGSGARLNLSKQRCFGILTGHFGITGRDAKP
jgi:hypothetical protein